MARAFEQAKGDLAERMLQALEAAQKAGGDVRGQQSAALLVVPGAATGRPWADRVFDLRVEDHPRPLEELRRLLTTARAYRHMNAGDLAVEKKDVAGALREYAAAERLVPDSAEMVYWHAVALVEAGRLEEALPLFGRAFRLQPGWRALTPKLPASGLLPDDAAVIRRILEAGGPAPATRR
jgi:tetratricopeptide (TPR) repeat protein